MKLDSYNYFEDRDGATYFDRDDLVEWVDSILELLRTETDHNLRVVFTAEIKKRLI